MADPKDKKKKLEKDTDFTDEQGGGGDAFTEKDFLDALNKATRPVEPSDEEK